MKQEVFLDHKLVAINSSMVKFTDSKNHAITFVRRCGSAMIKVVSITLKLHIAISLVCHPEEIWCNYTYSTMKPWKNIKPLKRGAVE